MSKNSCHLKFNTAYMEKDKIWFLPYNSRELFEMDVVSGEMTFLTSVDVPNYAAASFKGIMKHGDHIILAPYFGSCFLFYNFVKKTLKAVELEKDVKYEFSYGYSDGKYVYFTGTQPMIARIDPLTCEVQFFDVTPKKIENSMETVNGMWSRGKAVLRDGEIILPTFIDSKILYWNVCAEKGRFQKINGIDLPLSDLIVTDQESYALPRMGNVIYILEHDQSYKMYFEEANVELNGYFHLLYSMDQIFVLNYLSGDIYRLDREQALLKKEKGVLADSDFDNADSTMQIRWAGTEEDRLYLSVMGNSNLICWNFMENKRSEICMQLLNRDKYMEQVLQTQGYIYENPGCAELKDILKLVGETKHG